MSRWNQRRRHKRAGGGGERAKKPDKVKYLAGDLAVIRTDTGKKGDLVGRGSTGKTVLFRTPPQVEVGTYVAVRLLEEHSGYVVADCLFPFKGKLFNGVGPGLVAVKADGPEMAEAMVQDELERALDEDRKAAAAAKARGAAGVAPTPAS